MKVTVKYFAALREQRGLGQEQIETTAKTVGDLYAELKTQHGFSLASALVKAALGNEMAQPCKVLSAGDEIAFLPPVSGG